MTRAYTVPAPVALSSVQGSLALDHDDLSTPHRLAAVPAVGRSPKGGPGELDQFAHRFALAIVEVIGGDRGPQQLMRWTSDDVYADLVRRCAALQRVSPPDRRVRTLRAQVRSVRVFCPTPHSAELAVHVRHGHRSRAIAARLELTRERWCCVALQFG